MFPSSLTNVPKIILGSLIATLFASCSPDTLTMNPISQPQKSAGVVLEKGTPMGQLVQKTIGPEGGSLSSTDGTLTMTVPAGAIATATTFSVQPVSPTLPGLLGQSYRLLPEGLTFNQPVTLQYQYKASDLDSTSAQLLFMAYQSSDGIWRALPNTELDEAHQTLTVSTKHFSDWGAFSEFWLVIKNRHLNPRQSTELLVQGYDDMLAPLRNDAVELSQTKVLQNPDNIRNWQLLGEGALDVAGNKLQATYTAPVNVPAANPVSVSVDIYNFIPPNLQPRKGALGKAIIIDKIRINDGTYFRASLDGVTYESYFFGFINNGDSYTIQGNISETRGLMLTLNTAAIGSGQSFSYFKRDENEQEKAEVTYIDFNGSAQGYLSHYWDCADEHASPGNVVLSKVETIGGITYITGTYSATVYRVEGKCPGQVVHKKQIQAEFRMAEL